MKILIVSWFFPPYNAIGAVRVGKTAKYLYQAGHDVRVVTAANQLLDPSLALEIPAERVLSTRWVSLDNPAVWVLGGREHVQQRGFETSGRAGSLLGRLKPLYTTLVHVPDAQAGWIPFAAFQAPSWLAGWRPDLIFASALPISALLVAALLSKRLGVPWVAELRDLWGMDHKESYSRAAWRRPIDQALFHGVLSTASGLVTVSEPMKRWLAEAFHPRPACCVYNGFDPADFEHEVDVPFDEGRLTLVYTGTLYGGQRDPRPLFQALKLLGEERDKIRIHFYGRYIQPAAQIAQEEGVASSVVLQGAVPYAESIRRQMSADALLLLMMNQEHEDGGYTGKLFEYLGARRPILALGRDQNVACRLITERGAGFVSLEPAAIAAQLRRWLAQKAAQGTIPRLDPSVQEGFTRQGQAQRLETFLSEIAAV